MAIADRLRSALTENIGLKLLSFLCALLLYSLVHGSQDAQKSVSVDLVVLLPPDSAKRVLVSQLPPRVRVTLRGSRTALDELHGDDIGNLQLDIRGGQDKRVTIDPALVHVPAGIQVEQVDPPSIDLMWDDVVTRDVPVQVSLANTPPAGFTVKSAVADPVNVRVKGPKGRVNLLQHVTADAFDVSGLMAGNYTRSLALSRPDVGLAYDISSVSVALEIQRELPERSFAKLPIAVVGVPKAKTLPPDVDVRLACPPDVVHALRAEQVVPRVEVKTTEASGSESLPVVVTVDKCEAQITPQTVVVRW
jgi:YbbR domain-containing protein